MSKRKATKSRKTGETNINLELILDGVSEYENTTGVGFFDHMLDLFARHGRFGLKVNANGDTETGAHHTVEDVGIVLGQALDEALGDRAGIRRYGSALVPMDEALAECAIDISGRGGVLQRRRQLGEADPAHRSPLRHQRPPHDRGRLQGLRAGTARRRLDRPGGDGSSLDQGDPE